MKIEDTVIKEEIEKLKGTIFDISDLDINIISVKPFKSTNGNNYLCSVCKSKDNWNLFELKLKIKNSIATCYVHGECFKHPPYVDDYRTY